MTRRLLTLIAALAFAGLLPSTRAAAAVVLPTGFNDVPVVQGLSRAPSMALLPDLRLLVIEMEDGRVRLVVDGSLVAAPVAVIDSVRHDGESGLLGITVDPAWPAKPYVYLHYNYLQTRSIRIARYTAVGDVAFEGSGVFTLDLASRYLVLADLPDVNTNHNGGGLRFGADGMLYVCLGDDNDFCEAPVKSKLQGKILRLDVSGLPAGPGGPASFAAITPADNPFVLDPSPNARLVWARGLRNPYLIQVDPPTGDLVIADVGENIFEEVDLQVAPGQNFGWPIYEGLARYHNPICPPSDTLNPIFPIYAYDRTKFGFGAAVCASPRYRRPASGAYRFPAAYEGDIFVSDVGEGFLRRLHFDGTSWAIADSVPGQPTATEWGLDMDGVTDYFVHPDGSLWYLKFSERFANFTAEVRKIVYVGTTDVPGEATGGLTFAPPFPLPAEDAVTLAFATPRESRVRLAIFDLAGRVVRRLVDEPAMAAARYSRPWNLTADDGRRVAPGIYLAHLEVDGDRRVRRVLVLR